MYIEYMNYNTFYVTISKTSFLTKACLTFFTILIFYVSVNGQFVHPGIQHKKSDLERAKYGIKVGMEPWASSFANLKADALSTYDYVVRGNPSITYISRGAAVNKNEYESDMNAAYLNALMYWLTDDKRHADKAIEILNTWSNLTSVGGIPLDVGLYAAPMVNAAELIKHSNAGWAEEDIQKFSDMLVYPGYSNTTIPQVDIDADNHTFYWGIYNGDPSRAGNQELAAYKAMIAIGIFLDNELIYDRALRYVSGQTHRPDDLPYESGPKIPTSIISENPYQIAFNYVQEFTIPDYGYDGVITNYILDIGQCLESSRDQVHALYGVSLTAQIAEVAWNQGYDLYSIAENRILKGLEYGAKYNMSFLQSYPDQPEPWEPTVESGEFQQVIRRTARRQALQICPVYENNVDRLSRGVNINRPYWEMPLSHYKDRMNLPESDYLWTQRTRNYNIATSGKYEVRSASSTDSPGWGALTFGRVEGCAGDPISGFDSKGLPIYAMNVLPMTIEAENFDFFTTIGEDFTYNDTNNNNIGGAYRTDENVDIETDSDGGYNVGWIRAGEYLTYTVYVPETGLYNIAARVGSTISTGKIRVEFAGIDKTGDVSVANTGGAKVWQNMNIADEVILTKGVQPMRIYFAEGGYKLNSISIDKAGICRLDVFTDEQINAEDYCIGSGGGIRNAIAGGQYIASVQSGNYFNYGLFDFNTTKVNAFEVAYGKSSIKDTQIEIRLDSSTGTLISRVDASQSTGGSQNWTAKTADISQVFGTHEVFIVFTGQEGVSLANFVWFRLFMSEEFGCPTKLDLTGTAGNEVIVDYSAHSVISSNQDIHSGATVNYSANEIILDTEFTVEFGAVFAISIEGCE